LVDTLDAAAALPDLPEEIQLAMTDIAGAAREGLMAVSVAAGLAVTGAAGGGLMAMAVAAGLAVMAAMFEAEISEACGPKGKHDAGRAAVRHGPGRGSVTRGGRRGAGARPGGGPGGG